MHVQEMLRAMLQDGCRVDLFAAAIGGEPPADLRGIVVHALPAAPRNAPVSQREQHALRANREDAALLDRHGPFDIVYERHSLWSWAVMETARDHGWPGVLEINAPLIDEQITHRELVHREECRDAARRAFSAASVLLGVSQVIQQYVRRFRTDAPVYVIPNGVNPARFPPHIVPAIPLGVFTVGFLGTLKPWHGIDSLVEIADLIHADGVPFRLLVVGDGPERPKLEAEIASRGLSDHAILTGAVAAERVPALLTSMHVTLAPYPPLTGFYFSPLKIVESMAAGVPVVASRIGQIEALVRDGVDGLLCRPGDCAAFAAAVRRLRDDEAGRRGMAEAARQHVLAEHTWAANWRRVRALAAGAPVQEQRV